MFLVCRCLEGFNQLGIIDPHAKGSVNRIEVRQETIRGDLELSAGSCIQFLDEFYP